MRYRLLTLKNIPEVIIRTLNLGDCVVGNCDENAKRAAQNIALQCPIDSEIRVQDLETGEIIAIFMGVKERQEFLIEQAMREKENAVEN